MSENKLKRATTRFTLFLLIEAAVSIFAMAEMILNPDSSFYKVLFFSAVFLFVPTIVSIRTMIFSSRTVAENRIPAYMYPLPEVSLLVVVGAIYVTISIIYGTIYPNQQWPASVFSEGLVLQIWTVLVLLTYRRVNKILDRALAEKTG